MASDNGGANAKHFDAPSDSAHLKKASIAGSAAVTAAQVAKLVVQFVSQIILARLLFPQDFGLVAMVFPVISLIQIIGDFGFAQAIIQRSVLNQLQVSALFWVNLVVGLALGLVISLIAPLAAAMYGEPKVSGAMRVLAAMVPIAALGLHPNALLTRQMKFGILALNEFAAAVLGTLVSIGAALSGWSYWSVIAGTLTTMMINLSLNWMRCRWRPSAPSLASSVWSDLKFGGGITIANLANFITTSGDNMLIGLTVGKTALGLYDRSYRLVVQPLGQITAPISRIALPLFCRLIDQPERYRQSYVDLFTALFLLTSPIMLVCSTNSAVMIDWLLGSRWAAAAPVFSWICLGGLTSGVYPSAAWLFISQARTGELASYLTIAAVLNLSSFLLGSLWGIVGIAAGGALSFVLVTSPMVLMAATRSGPVARRDVLNAALPIVLQCVLAFAALKLQLNMGQKGFVQLVLASLTCFFVFFVSGTTVKQQRRLVARIWAEIQSRLVRTSCRDSA